MTQSISIQARSNHFASIYRQNLSLNRRSFLFKQKLKEGHDFRAFLNQKRNLKCFSLYYTKRPYVEDICGFVDTQSRLVQEVMTRLPKPKNYDPFVTNINGLCVLVSFEDCYRIYKDSKPRDIELDYKNELLTLLKKKK